MDRRFEWTKPIECRSRHLYGNGNGDGIRLYEQHELYSEPFIKYHSRWKCNATDVWTNQWFDKCDPKHRSDLCMDRRFEWTKPIECRSWNIYCYSYRDVIGLYEQHELYREPFIKYHSRWKCNATNVRNG